MTDIEQPELYEEEFADEEEKESESQILPPYDINPEDRKLVTHPYDFIIRSLKDQIEDGTLVLADKFQRRRVWDNTKASRLIESLLLNVPVPVCYFAEIDDGAYSVIDGQQRLTAIYQFLDNQFPLRGLRIRHELNKLRYYQLSKKDARLISSRTLRCIVILRESHPDIRFDVFERLNTSSVKLNAQELRNSVFRGKLNDLIIRLSEDEVFQRTRNAADIDKRMKDCELILRFFAFHYNLDHYRSSLSRFLDDYLDNGRRFAPEQIAEHERIFEKTIRDVDYVFGSHAFKRYVPTKNGGNWENLTNRAIYDVIVLSFARIPSDIIRENAEAINTALQNLCLDSEFSQAITSGTQAIRALQTRLDKWVNALREISIDVPTFKVGRETGA